MSKGLQAFNKIKNDSYKTYEEERVCYEIVEKALEDYEQHEEILNDYGLTLVNFREACLLLAMLKGDGRNIHNINKQLKALEIIKDNEIDIRLFKKTKSYKDYYPLTKEEYDLLKEVLK